MRARARREDPKRGADWTTSSLRPSGTASVKGIQKLISDVIFQQGAATDEFLQKKFVDELSCSQFVIRMELHFKLSSSYFLELYFIDICYNVKIA